MNPPPPILPALGCVTASANAVATAASTAVPPLASTAAPASQAGADVQTTRPSFDETPWSFAACVAGGRADATTSNRAAATEGDRRILTFIAAAYTITAVSHRRAAGANGDRYGT